MDGAAKRAHCTARCRLYKTPCPAPEVAIPLQCDAHLNTCLCRQATISRSAKHNDGVDPHLAVLGRWRKSGAGPQYVGKAKLTSVRGQPGERRRGRDTGCGPCGPGSRPPAPGPGVDTGCGRGSKSPNAQGYSRSHVRSPSSSASHTPSSSQRSPAMSQYRVGGELHLTTEPTAEPDAGVRLPNASSVLSPSPMHSPTVGARGLPGETAPSIRPKWAPSEEREKHTQYHPWEGGKGRSRYSLLSTNAPRSQFRQGHVQGKHARCAPDDSRTSRSAPWCMGLSHCNTLRSHSSRPSKEACAGDASKERSLVGPPTFGDGHSLSGAGSSPVVS
jgi:hypothetical protein